MKSSRVSSTEPAQPASTARRDAGIGLYVHVPFCARACPYCDFDFAVNRAPDVLAYLGALQSELHARRIVETMPVHTLYVGGGTPSVLGPAGLAALLGWLGERFDVSAVAETTVELNPEHVDASLIEALREVGVDRVSLGVQSLDPGGLRQLGRMHDRAQALGAMRACVQAGLRVSADLIVGWPGQSLAVLEEDLNAVMATGAGHVSIYALSIEPGTPWERMVARGQRALPRAEHQADVLARTEAILTAAGFDHYEVASYARPGEMSQHNRGYWTGRDYVGLGPSAGSATTLAGGVLRRRTNPRGWTAWQGDPAAGDEERLEPLEAAAEALWVGLRLLEGIDIGALIARFDGRIDAAWVRHRAKRQLQRGNLVWEGQPGRLRVAEGRWLWHDEICADLL